LLAAVEARCVQETLKFILRLVVNASSRDEFLSGLRLLTHNINQLSRFDYQLFRTACWESQEVLELSQRIHKIIPSITWTLEPTLGPNGSAKNWEINPYLDNFDELYSLIMANLARSVAKGNLWQLRQCAWQKCRRFFALKGQPGPHA